MFTVTRIFNDNMGDSFFEDINISLKDAGDISLLSEKLPATGVVFSRGEKER